MKITLNRYNKGGGHPLLYHPLVLKFFPEDLSGKTIVDLGCGKGIYAYLIRATKNSTGVRLIGVDKNKENIRFVNKFKVYNDTAVSFLPQMNLVPKKVDYVLCSEVLEHLSKDKGVKLLDNIDKMCKKMAIVTTPNILFQPAGNEDFDKHVSLWSVKEFKNRGFNVYGIGIKIPPASGRYRLWEQLFYGIEYIATPFSWIFPQISGSLIAVKNYNQ